MSITWSSLPKNGIVDEDSSLNLCWFDKSAICCKWWRYSSFKFVGFIDVIKSGWGKFRLPFKSWDKSCVSSLFIVDLSSSSLGESDRYDVAVLIWRWAVELIRWGFKRDDAWWGGRRWGRWRRGEAAIDDARLSVHSQLKHKFD